MSAARRSRFLIRMHSWRVLLHTWRFSDGHFACSFLWIQGLMCSRQFGHERCFCSCSCSCSCSSSSSSFPQPRQPLFSEQRGWLILVSDCNTCQCMPTNHACAVADWFLNSEQKAAGGLFLGNRFPEKQEKPKPQVSTDPFEAARNRKPAIDRTTGRLWSRTRTGTGDWRSTTEAAEVFDVFCLFEGKCLAYLFCSRAFFGGCLVWRSPLFQIFKRMLCVSKGPAPLPPPLSGI